MSDLANQTPASTYKGLLQVNDYTNGVDGTSKFVQDGEGTDSALSVSTTKVGVGTASPSVELEVNGNVVATTLTTSGAVTAGSVSTSGAVGAGSIDVSGNVVADEYALDQTGSSSSAVAIHAPATNELAIRTNSTERLRIDSSGNLGIGTDIPQHILDVRSSEDLTTFVGTQTPGVGIKNENTAVDNVALLAFKSSEANTVLAGVGMINRAVAPTANASVGDLAFYSKPSGVSYLNDSPSMLIDSNGRCGIGTTSPSAPLEVASTTGGVIMPRLNTTQMNAISSPTDGEMIYNTTENKFYGRANGAWTALH